MNARSQPERESLALVEIIQLKWLMTHLGQHVHVERMQTDPAYAGSTLAMAEGSGERELCRAAASVRNALDVHR